MWKRAVSANTSGCVMAPPWWLRYSAGVAPNFVTFTLASGLFFAEEEFYLLALPILFWNIDYRLARHMTLVVCFGLLWGNLMKDVFRLPRPVNVEPKVWVAHVAVQIAGAGDGGGTACRDFGFPSTHAMNSVSNALFWVMYSLQHGIAGKATNPVLLFVGALVWISSITFSRIYLGVHSPMDIKGGLLLGLALTFIMQWPVCFCDIMDRWMLTQPHVGVLLMFFLAVVLILNPQPRPMTPTFMQNCVLCGLTWGCSVGFRMETDRRAGRGIMGFGATPSENGYHKGSNDRGFALLFLRTLVGYIIVLLIRAVLKELLVILFHKFGLEPNPAKPFAELKEKEKQPELKGWDLWAAAMTKTMVYAAMAWSITCACPAFFEVIGLPSEMNG